MMLDILEKNIFVTKGIVTLVLFVKEFSEVMDIFAPGIFEKEDFRGH